jgi:hypothetical protein
MEEHGRHCKSLEYVVDNAIVYRDVYRELSAEQRWRIISGLPVSVQDRCQALRSLPTTSLLARNNFRLARQNEAARRQTLRVR